jgi:hypothetical protein
MSSDFDRDIFWDATQEQLGLNGPISRERLESAGYQHLARDGESAPPSVVEVYLKPGRHRWYLQLVHDGVVVSTALCFSSEQLGEIIREFQTVAGVLA